jgi:hypothetical protein
MLFVYASFTNFGTITTFMIIFTDCFPGTGFMKFIGNFRVEWPNFAQKQ